jgi:hypothetical protein
MNTEDLEDLDNHDTATDVIDETTDQDAPFFDEYETTALFS